MNKIPCIKCTPELWEYIEPYLEKWGYKMCSVTPTDAFPLVVINRDGILGRCCSLLVQDCKKLNRELVTDVEEFLKQAAKLKGFAYKSF